MKSICALAVLSIVALFFCDASTATLLGRSDYAGERSPGNFGNWNMFDFVPVADSSSPGPGLDFSIFRFAHEGMRKKLFQGDVNPGQGTPQGWNHFECSFVVASPEDYALKFKDWEGETIPGGFIETGSPVTVPTPEPATFFLVGAGFMVLCVVGGGRRGSG